MYMHREKTKKEKNLAMKEKHCEPKFYSFTAHANCYVFRRTLPSNSALKRNKERGTPKPCVCTTEIFQKSPVNGGINIR